MYMTQRLSGTRRLKEKQERITDKYTNLAILVSRERVELEEIIRRSNEDDARLTKVKMKGRRKKCLYNLLEPAIHLIISVMEIKKDPLAARAYTRLTKDVNGLCCE